MGSQQRTVIPGMRICAAEDHYQAGTGTYVLHGYIYASLVGHLKLVSRIVEAGNSDSKTGSSAATTSTKEMVTVEVQAPGEETGLVPRVGDVVTCRVLSVNPRFAKMQILCVGDTVLKDAAGGFRCQLRKEDVRAHDKDRVEMYKCFRPSDVVLARVLSYGEANSGYLVTTAENEFGVVIARSELSGEKMVPISWTEMQCPKTFNKENRKIAKVVPEDGLLTQ